jgi:hypothetical protein
MRFAPLLMAALFLPISSSAAGPDGLVTGQYIEERSNRVYGCPCEFSSEWADGGRTAILAWNLQSGTYGGEELRGLRLVAVIAADSSLSVTLANPRSTLFVDESSPAAQRRAGVAWLRLEYGDLLGQVLGEHATSIDFRQDGDTASVRIPDTLIVEMRRADVARDAESWAFLLYGPLIKVRTSTMAVTLQDRYSGLDLRSRWAREGSPISGYFGEFALKSRRSN